MALLTSMHSVTHSHPLCVMFLLNILHPRMQTVSTCQIVNRQNGSMDKTVGRGSSRFHHARARRGRCKCAKSMLLSAITSDVA
ncbi:hypothetical protein B0H13DRAFT_2013611 [Mycena leptocephala]|nr:hypothetical protein B0H13DRAFT_2013608 [Mycena leptocephala]KAJ7909842.1 hypothetical protein B0H13DRAFT_2013611 [Mycena leptocephala]